MNINFKTLQERLIPFFIVIVIAYFINFILFINLPKSGVEFEEKSTTNFEYKNYLGFYNIGNNTSNKNIELGQKNSFKKVKLSSYTLKAIYSTSSNKGWAILEQKNKKESIVISHNEMIEGYLLKSLFKNYIIFEKNFEEFKLELKKQKEINYSIEKNSSSSNESIIVSNGKITIKRDFINSYVNDLEKVWRDISVKEYKINNKFQGFKIIRVNKNSVLNKLGLQKNDVIKSVNGNEFKSYNDVFKVYKNMNNMGNLNMKILRNNEMVELDYEIN